MFGWMFKKPFTVGSKAAPAAPKAAAPATPAPAPKPAAPKPVPSDPGWEGRLQAATGDDAAVLALAQATPLLEAKLAAVGALVGEAALKQAEKLFRNNDRRVHRLAKQRLGECVALREAGEHSAVLTAQARALLQDAEVPVNRLVELDRAWQALDQKHLDDRARAEFRDAIDAVTAQIRDRGEQALLGKRWSGEATKALSRLKAACAEAAAGNCPRTELAIERASAQALLDEAPEGSIGTGLQAALAAAVQTLAALDERLDVLEKLLAGRLVRHPATEAPADAAATVHGAEPAVKPVCDAPPVAVEEAAALASATEDAQTEHAPAPATADSAAAVDSVDATEEPPTEAQAAEGPVVEVAAVEVVAAETVTDDVVTAKVSVAEIVVEQTETEAPAEGAVTAAASADAPPAQEPAPAPAPRARRPDALQSWQQLPPLADAALEQALQLRVQQWQQAQEAARLDRRSQQRERVKDQQRAQRSERNEGLASILTRAEAALEGGHLADTHKELVALDEMLHQGAPVESLRARIDEVQARYAQLKGWQHWAGGRARDDLTLEAEALAAAAGGTGETRTVKISLQQQAELIEGMRTRWKELDRLGGATSRALWQRFDAALKVAYEPIAANLAAQRAARELNLQTRRGLIAELDTVPLPAAEAGTGPEVWRAAAEALGRFHTEWRKLGPVEHTVPRKAQPALLEQLGTATARLEGPLQQARQAAQAEREQILARARSLAEQAAAGQARDSVQQVRELQAAWQQHARALPLQRAAENALWADFKGALDAVFSARDAAFNAREAEFKAYGAERLALVERLEALTADTPAGELKRTLGEAESQWQRCGPAPRNDAAALDRRWLAARDSARRLLADSAKQRWRQVCDTLTAKLALCEQAQDEATRAERWDALPALPAAWEQALRQRAGLAPGGGAGRNEPTPVVDDLLLQLEAAWDLESPAAFHDARRNLKLQAMKAAMESRRQEAARAPEELLSALLQQTGLDAGQRGRRDALLAGLRERGHASA